MLARHLLSSCVCLDICLSVTSRYCIKTTGRIELSFSMEASSHLIAHCVIRRFEYFRKQGYFPLIPLKLCSKLWTWKISPRQVDRVVNESSSTVELVDDTYDGRSVVAIYYTSINRNPLTPYIDLFWICCTSCSYSCAAVDKISPDIACRAVRLRYSRASC